MDKKIRLNNFFERTGFGGISGDLSKQQKNTIIRDKINYNRRVLEAHTNCKPRQLAAIENRLCRLNGNAYLIYAGL